MSLVDPFSWLVNHFFLIFMVLLGGVIPRVKGSSSLQENLDNFLNIRWIIQFAMYQCLRVLYI